MKFCVFVLASVLAANPAAAAPDPAPKPVVIISPVPLKSTPLDPLAITAAERMLDAQDFAQQAMDGSEVMIEAMLASISERLAKVSDEPLPEELMADLRKAVREHSATTLKASLPAIRRKTAEIYAREFTRAEIERMRLLAVDPVMVKMRAKTRLMAAEMMMLGVNAMREAEPALEARIEKIIADHLAKTGQGSPRAS